MRWCQLTICMMQLSEFSYFVYAYKIKQIYNKANHLLEFEYTLLGSTSTCTWNSVLVLVLVLVNFASTCTCTWRVSKYLYLYLYLTPKYLYLYLYLHTVYLWHHWCWQIVFVTVQKHFQLLLSNIFRWLYRFVVRDFVYDEQEITEERREQLKLIDEKKMQFVSYDHDLNCFSAIITRHTWFEAAIKIAVPFFFV